MKILFVFISILTLSFDCLSQGLQFQGQGILMEERASYTVFETVKPKFKNQFEIGFDLSFHNIDPFGYIFLLKDEKSKTEYNLIYVYDQEGKSFLKFNLEGKGNLTSIELNTEELDKRAWVRFSCSFLLQENQIKISVNNKQYLIENPSLPSEFIPGIVFGINDNSVDIPSFSIRNLIVSGDGEYFIFPFNESTGTDVHDLKGKSIGQVSNPVWLINNAYYWRHRFSTQSKSVSGINYHASTQDMLFFNRDSLLAYNMLTDTFTSIKYPRKLPLNMQLGTSFIDNADNKLYIYEVIDYSDNSENVIASLNLSNNIPTALGNDQLPTQLHHHAGFLDSKNNRYIIFGGFGHKKYNNEFFSFDLSANKWNILHYSGDKIMPRFFQGMTNNGDNLYIFGGLGNESGDQTIGRHNFYDLYRFDLNERKSVKLWEIEWTGKNIVPARNMIILNDSVFYALCYPEYEPNSYVQLYEFLIKDGKYRILGDSIHFRSDKITTNVNLYYNDVLHEFYCSIQEFEDDGSSSSKIYSLSYPAITKDELTLYNKTEIGFPLWSKILFSILPVIFLLGIFLLLKKRRKVIRSDKPDTKNIFPEQMQNEKIELSRNTRNAIYLFGEFTVYDKKGKDISYMFSTRLRNTFLLVLQHSE